MRKLSHITLLDQYAVDMDIILGKGSTGCVYQGLQMKTGRKVAIKIVDLRTIDNEVAEYLLNMQKTAIMKVNNPNVLQGLKVAQDSRYCFMVTEYCNGGTLKKYIKSFPQGYLSQQKSLKILYQLLLGYKSLVQKGIIHRDLKPANIMLHNDVAKIIDFGYCQIKGYQKPKIEYNVGSPSYMAPQSFSQNIYNEKTQIWALGVILFQCLTGKTIDEGRHMSEVYYELLISGVPYPPHVGYLARNIINWCLSRNPKDRPTCLQLIQSYFPTKGRSKSKLSPCKPQLQKVVQINKYPSQKQSKAFKQLHLNQKYSKQDSIFKSTRLDVKAKPYKMPQFLTASVKNKLLSNTSNLDKNNRLNTCFSSHGYYPGTTCPVRISKSGKQRNTQYCESKAKNENKQNKEQKLDSFWEYGNLKNIPRNSSKVLSTHTKVSLNQMYSKIVNSPNMDKNRVLSTQVSPGIKQKMSKNTSKELFIRNKRTLTDRAALIRA